MQTTMLLTAPDDLPSPDWRLDDATRDVGLRGVAAARMALAATPAVAAWASAPASSSAHHRGRHARASA